MKKKFEKLLKKKNKYQKMKNNMWSLHHLNCDFWKIYSNLRLMKCSGLS